MRSVIPTNRMQNVIHAGRALHVGPDRMRDMTNARHALHVDHGAHLGHASHTLCYDWKITPLPSFLNNFPSTNPIRALFIETVSQVASNFPKE